MQELWAKILYVEVNDPGSFSLKTLKIFRAMNIKEAKIFSKACAVAVCDINSQNIRIITGYNVKAGILNSFAAHKNERFQLNRFGLSYTDIMILAGMNILFAEEIESTSSAKQGKLQFSYNGLAFNIKPKKSDCILSFYKFTQVGTELAQLISDSPDEEFYADLKLRLGYHYDISN